MVFVLLSLGLFSADVEIVNFVPQEIKCAVPIIIKSIDSSKDINGLLDAWENLPSHCSIDACCIDTSENLAEGYGYRWKRGRWTWEMRPSIFEENDSTCWAEYVISFQTPSYYSTSVFKRDFSFIPRGNKAGWMRGKEYASYSFSMPSENVHASGWLSGRIGRLKFFNKKSMPCVKREYKFHYGGSKFNYANSKFYFANSLVFCDKPGSDQDELFRW